MALEKWIIHPGETRVIDIEDVRSLKIGMVGGQIDVIAHDEPGARIEVHGVTDADARGSRAPQGPRWYMKHAYFKSYLGGSSSCYPRRPSRI